MVRAAGVHSDSTHAGLRVRRLDLQAGPGGSPRGPGGGGEARPRPPCPASTSPSGRGAVTAPLAGQEHTWTATGTRAAQEDAWTRTSFCPCASSPPLLLPAPCLAAWPEPLTRRASLAVALPWGERCRRQAPRTGPASDSGPLPLAASGDCPGSGQVGAPGPQHHATSPKTNFFTEATICMYTGFCPFCPRPSLAAYLRIYPSMI